MTESVVFQSPLFGAGGNWIKAGFHCHSDKSDGGLSPADTVAYYRDKGFQCMGISDHRCVTPMSSFAEEGFVGLNATENGGHPDIIGINVSEPVPEEYSLRERARLITEQGGFAVTPHPTYSEMTPEDVLKTPELGALEIYNAYCDNAYANGMAVELWDMVLGMGKRIWGLAGDDAHLNENKRFYSDAGLAWVEILVDELSSRSIMHSLRTGSFYSTQGPKFYQFSLSGSRPRIDCSPVNQVRWITFGKVGHVEYATDGNGLTTSKLPEWFSPSTFVRIEIVDSDGKKAWSNPFFCSRSS